VDTRCAGSKSTYSDSSAVRAPTSSGSCRKPLLDSHLQLTTREIKVRHPELIREPVTLLWVAQLAEPITETVMNLGADSTLKAWPCSRAQTAACHSTQLRVP